jgi:hypothetical protein
MVITWTVMDFIVNVSTNLMLGHLLLTTEQQRTRPANVKIMQSWGELTIIFDGENGEPGKAVHGLHCFIEGYQEDIISWLKPYDAVYVGNGSPMMETFSVVHIK